MRPRTFLRTLSIIHAALCTGLLIFTILGYWKTGGFGVVSKEGDIFVYLVPLVAMVGYFSSTFVHRKLIETISKNETLPLKLSRYQTALLIKYAMIEAPAIMALFAYFQSGTALYLVIALALLIYLYAQRPTRKRLMEEVPLNFEEKKQFDTFRS